MLSILFIVYFVLGICKLLLLIGLRWNPYRKGKLSWSPCHWVSKERVLLGWPIPRPPLPWFYVDSSFQSFRSWLECHLLREKSSFSALWKERSPHHHHHHDPTTHKHTLFSLFFITLPCSLYCICHNLIFKLYLFNCLLRFSQ